MSICIGIGETISVQYSNTDRRQEFRRIHLNSFFWSKKAKTIHFYQRTSTYFYPFTSFFVWGGFQTLIYTLTVTHYVDTLIWWCILFFHNSQYVKYIWKKINEAQTQPQSLALIHDHWPYIEIIIIGARCIYCTLY